SLSAWKLLLPYAFGGNSEGQRVLLTVHPREPLVELGGSIQLACAMDCPNGKLQWLGLDTDLGNVVSNQTHSILTVANVTIPMAGTKRCSGQCRREHSLAKVDLRVYCEFLRSHPPSCWPPVLLSPASLSSLELWGRAHPAPLPRPNAEARERVT
uniref:Intercellular adhesion molecule N-terminal domain-containing protein n=1 Tax=Varanus komodoensis TaxID=61221 RepID=A0A8D2KRX1_VARKO